LSLFTQNRLNFKKRSKLETKDANQANGLINGAGENVVGDGECKRRDVKWIMDVLLTIIRFKKKALHSTLSTFIFCLNVLILRLLNII
jgi:hypothetical protein